MREGAIGHEADPSRHHLRQVARTRSARRSIPTTRATGPTPPDDLDAADPLMRDAVRAFGLHAGRAGALRGRRPHRHLCRQAARPGADVTHRLVRQGPDAARPARRGDVYDFESGDQKASPATGPSAIIGEAEVIEKFGVPPGPDRRRAGADRRHHRQRAGRARHRPEDRGAADQGISATSRRCSRAPREIKQPKRRETLIDNAEQARLSKQLVTLDRRRGAARRRSTTSGSPSSTPKRLIAFLKAMEFTTLTRRIAEMLRRRRRRRSSPIRALERAGAARRSRRRRWRRAGGRCRRSGAAPGRHRRAPSAGSAAAGAPARRPPRARPRRRSRAAIAVRHRRLRDDRQPRAARRLDRRGARAPASSPSTPRPTSLDADAGRARRLLARARARPRPATCRSRHRGKAATCSAAALAAGPDPARRGARAAEAAAGGPGGPQDRPEPQVRLAGAARHGIERRALSTTPC